MYSTQTTDGIAIAQNRT